MAFGNKENSKRWSQRVLIISWKLDFDLTSGFTWQVKPFVSSQGCNRSHSSFICDAHLLQHSHSSQNIPVPGLHCGRSFLRPTETASGKSHGGHVAGHLAPLFDLYRASWTIFQNSKRKYLRILFLERGLSYEIYFWFNPDPGQVKLKF